MPFMFPVTGEQVNWNNDQLLELFYESKARKLNAALYSLGRRTPVKFTPDELEMFKTDVNVDKRVEEGD
jgi:hypothetical protein